MLDENKVKALTDPCRAQPTNTQPRIELGNLYFDAERYPDAIKWYAEAFKLNPKDVNVSTDLGVSYYYTNQPDRALEQFDESLKINPKHAKTLLNIGIVRAFGKQDSAVPSRRGSRSFSSRPTALRVRRRSARWTASSRRTREAARRGREAWCLMIRFILLSVLLRFSSGGVTPLGGIVRRHAGSGRVRGPDARQRAVSAAAGVQMVRDPVCGTFVVPERAVALLDERARSAVFLLDRMPRQVPGAARSRSRSTRRPHRMTPESLLRADIVEVGRRMYARGYTASNDGNISVRLGDDRLLMTPKSVCKGFMTPDMMCITDLSGRKLQGDRDPSSEMLMHLEVYRQRPDVQRRRATRIRPSRPGSRWPAFRSIARCSPRC